MDDNYSLGSVPSVTDLSTLQSGTFSPTRSFDIDSSERHEPITHLPLISLVDIAPKGQASETRKEMTGPPSLRFTATKLALYYGLKTFLHLPRFNAPWYAITRSLNGLIANSAETTEQPDFHELHLPVKTLPTRGEADLPQESRTIKITVYHPIPPKEAANDNTKESAKESTKESTKESAKGSVKESTTTRAIIDNNGSNDSQFDKVPFHDCIDQIAQPDKSGYSENCTYKNENNGERDGKNVSEKVSERSERDGKAEKHDKHILFFFGGGYLFGHNGQCSTPMRQLAENGFTVWTPEYTLLPHGAKDISKRNLEEALTVYRHICNQSKNGPTSIGIYGDSAGGEIVIRLAQYCASINQPIKSPIHLASPAHLEELTEEDVERADPNQEYVLPAFQLLGLQKSMRHRPVTDHATHYFDSVETLDTEELDAPWETLKEPEGPKKTFSGTAPVRITIGDGELMHGPAKRLHRQLIKDGVDAHLDNYIGLIHSGESLADQVPELQRRLTDTIDWLRAHVE